MNIAERKLFGGRDGQGLLFLATTNPDVNKALAPIRKEAIGWDKLPKGWTQESVEKFWASLTGDAKHKVTKCMKKMRGKFDDPGAFCASLADMIEGNTKWRGKKAADKYRSKKHPQDVGIEVKAEGRKTTYLWKGKPAFSFIKDVKFPDGRVRKVTFIKDRRGGKTLWVSHNIPKKTSSKRVAHRYLESFNKYNAPELLGQLITVLKKEGLDDVVADLKRKGVPRLVNDAWGQRDKIG